MIQTKRNSLEKFLREQMEGPGGCNGHFGYINDNDNGEEVINTTPGSLYSTAVLFPQRKAAEITSSDSTTVVTNTDASELESDSLYQESLDDNSSEELDERVNRLGADEEDLYSLSQRFPTTIGVSCCLDKNGSPLVPTDLSVTISGRYYTKISNKECCNIVIKIDDEAGFKTFFNEYKSQLELFFATIEDGIQLIKDITKEIKTVKDTILSINKELCKKVALNPDETIDKEYEQIGDNYRYLKSYKERL